MTHYAGNDVEKQPYMLLEGWHHCQEGYGRVYENHKSI